MAPFQAAGESLAAGSLIEVAGVAFFDKIHGQDGRAPNGIELHPVLSVALISRN